MAPPSVSSGHTGGAFHSGPSLSFSGSSRSFAPPSGSLFTNSSAALFAGRMLRPEWLGQRLATHRSGAASLATTGVVWDIVDVIPISTEAMWGWAPSATVSRFRTPTGMTGDDAGGSPLGPQQADYGDQPVNDYGPEGPQVAAYAPSPFRPAYQEQVETTPALAQPITTLIFKDGRPPAQVRNYALTNSTLYALDGESRKEIPLSLLDVPATVTANQAAGVDFALPVNR